MFYSVITTIQQPTDCVTRLARRLSDCGGRLVVAGDTKGPTGFDLSPEARLPHERVDFLDIERQLASGFELAKLLPVKHYARKNVGYLKAIAGGCSCLYETDDDNAPLEHWGRREAWVRDLRFAVTEPSEEASWVNVYRAFSDELIWPRGLPLEQIRGAQTFCSERPEWIEATVDETGACWAPIQQGLADGAPDVDAIWRLVLDRDFRFEGGASVLLSPGQWCPFNTQTTWWWPEVFPLLYVPSFCSFRMCDIWKSFVAQRCVWELGAGIVFHAPEVVQERNPHNLMRDFDDEVPGYQQNHQIAETLERVKLSPGVEHVGESLRRCYGALVRAGFFPEKELPLVDAWLSDLGAIDSSRLAAEVNE